MVTKECTRDSIRRAIDLKKRKIPSEHKQNFAFAHQYLGIMFLLAQIFA
jgi:hypothetical protein